MAIDLTNERYETGDTLDFITKSNTMMTKLEADSLRMDTDFAPLASPSFTGTVTLATDAIAILPSDTTIGALTSDQIGYLTGLTSDAQTQINSKAPSTSPTFTGTITATSATSTLLPANTQIGALTSDEISYLGGVTSSIQTQINGKAPTTVAQGQHTIWMPSGAMIANLTNGATTIDYEYATNDVMVRGFDFDASTEESVQFGIQMPKSWNASTLVAQFIWTTGTTAGTGNVVWGIQSTSLTDSDALDVAYPAVTTVIDSFITSDDIHISAETSTFTPNGAGAEEYVVFKVTREAANGSDTYTQDARLLGVKIHYTTNSATDD